MATTLLLDRVTWDLCVDTAGNIAVAAEPYAQAQDIASEARVFAGECYYDITRGVPYFSAILGHFQPVQIIKESLARAAKLVPGVIVATVFLSRLQGREIAGQIQFTSDSGQGMASL
ncbi:hypothetical protein [Sphingomonas sp. VL_57B]|jgi:hypothetical protein|uniref:hypothetical protein n=1 Tax=Sphingomonas sp. VL_57B TaxID=3144220 RepID=UPI0031F520FC